MCTHGPPPVCLSLSLLIPSSSFPSSLLPCSLLLLFLTLPSSLLFPKLEHWNVLSLMNIHSLILPLSNTAEWASGNIFFSLVKIWIDDQQCLDLNKAKHSYSFISHRPTFSPWHPQLTYTSNLPERSSFSPLGGSWLVSVDAQNQYTWHV